MTKRNKYILLTILCVTLIIIFQTVISPPSPLKRDIKLPSEEQILSSPYSGAFITFSLVYLTLIIIGLANFISFIVRKLFKKPLIEFQEQIKPFPLGETQTSKLILLTISFLLLTYLIEIFVFSFPPLFSAISSSKTVLMNFFIILNLSLETAVIILILNFLKPSFLDFTIKKTHMRSLLKTYTAMLPIILIALFINNFLVRQTNIPPSINPAIELLLLLKNKFSISILLLQVMLLGPIAEEMFFRGVIYKLMRKQYPFIISAIFTSVFFSLIHGTPQDTFPLFIISIGLCYIYEKTQNILSPIIMHSIHNTINICFLLTLKNII
jgi:membrane protease YdiL (CAAX protease family)